MRVSQKTEYALRAMLELARHYGQFGPVRTADIAKSQHIPEKFLELILVELRRSGLIFSQRGSVGGYRLARDPQRISVGDIWRAIEGQAFETERAGADPFGAIWVQIDRAVSQIVDTVTLEDMRLRSDARQSAPDFNI